MNAEVFPRLIRAIHEQHLDGLLAVSPENVAYVVGFPVGGPGEPRWRQAAALVTWDGRTALLCVDAHAEAIRRRMRAETVVRSWGEFGDNPTHILADLLAEFHLSQSRVGTELDSLAAADFRVLTARFPNVTWAPAEGLLTRLRRVKGPREVERLRHLSRIVDQAFMDVLTSLKREVGEREARALFAQQVLRLGAEECRVAVRRAEAGERSAILGVEVTACIEGYHAVMARTAAPGLPGELRRKWKEREAAHRRLIEALTPGGSGDELSLRTERLQATLGLPGESLVAHGIGLASVEEPFLGPFPEPRVEADMVLAVGPEGTAPWPLRDMVLVTPNGPELLTHRSHPAWGIAWA
ncbi:MAG: aminopeptidase P family protein [candidate division NC10 bacterium]|nr:aminopeptidase P family protein [candidate division NC10 bacterium]